MVLLYCTCNVHSDLFTAVYTQVRAISTRLAKAIVRGVQNKNAKSIMIRLWDEPCTPVCEQRANRKSEKGVKDNYGRYRRGSRDESAPSGAL